jgi:hypothetical protein
MKMSDPTPEQIEEAANELLKKEAVRHGGSLRKLGIIDERRERTIREREIPLSSFERGNTRRTTI